MISGDIAPVGDNQRRYHTALQPGELADYLLLANDPARIAWIAERWDSIELERSNREFHTITGTYRSLRLSAMSIGIGTDNVEVALAEILTLVDRPTMIKIGFCGALQEGIDLGDLIVTSGAVRMDATTFSYVHDGYPAVADYMIVSALVEAASARGRRVHVGITATASGYYAPQGRLIPQWPTRTADLVSGLQQQRVLNMEMEASALLVLAGLASCRAGVVCAAYAHRIKGGILDSAEAADAEVAVVETALDALVIASQMEAAVRKAGATLWSPSLDLDR